MGATLSLSRKDPVPAVAPEHGIAFNEGAHYAEICGMQGARYVQGKALFNHAKKYLGPAPKEMWLAPLTSEQERERQKRILANKKFFGTSTAVAKAAKSELPKEVLDAERENKKALAAESRAA